jgi:hypothetical protein
VLRPEQPLEGHLGARIDEDHGDVDIYGFEVTAGTDAVSLRATEVPNIDLAIDVFRAGRPDPIVVIDAMPLGGPEAAPNLPLDPGLYLARVHEVRVAGRYPVENVSDSYSISWAPVTRGPSDEHEWNDGTSQAEVLELSGPSIERTGFIGWDGDIDTFCVASAREPLSVRVSAIESLDLVLESTVDGRTLTTNEHGRGEGESLTIDGAETARRACVRISAGVGAQRGDATSTYTLSIARGAPEPSDAP